MSHLLTHFPPSDSVSWFVSHLRYLTDLVIGISVIFPYTANQVYWHSLLERKRGKGISLLLPNPAASSQSTVLSTVYSINTAVDHNSQPPVDELLRS